MGRALNADARDLRLVWGAAAFPQMFALAVLLPSDVLVVGPEAFTTARLTDPVSSAWASLSIAVGVALALWSWGLLAKGVEVAAGVRFRIGLLATLGGGLCVAVCIALLRFGALALLELLA
jgi:hypothetical protein